MAHGRVDPVIPFEFGELSAKTLTEAGFDVEWHEYPMAHAVCSEEIAAIRQWLMTILESTTGPYLTYQAR